MSRKSGQCITDRQKIIGWYKDDITRYRGIIGQETEYGTKVTNSLIENLEKRVKELEEKEKNQMT